MSILNGELSEQEALTKIARQEEIEREHIKTCEAVSRLMSNPDFNKLLDSLKEQTFEQTLNLAQGGQLAEAASRTLSGISRFFDLLGDYPRQHQASVHVLQELAHTRQEVLEQVAEMNKGE